MASTKKPRAKKTKAIADVARPGQSAPAATSKSVIITNRPVIQDPMMTADVPATPATTVAIPIKKGSTEKRLQPTSAPPLPAATVPSAAPQISEMIARATKTPTARPAPRPIVDVKQPKPLPPKVADKPDEAVSDVPVEISAKDAAEAKTVAVEQQAALQKLITSKRYYLPINAIEKRRTKRVIAFGIFISLVLLLLWANIALDAGLIHVGGLKSVTHFFSS